METVKKPNYNLRIYGQLAAAIVGVTVFSGGIVRSVAIITGWLVVWTLWSKRKELNKNQKLYGWIGFIVFIVLTGITQVN